MRTFHVDLVLVVFFCVWAAFSSTVNFNLFRVMDAAYHRLTFLRYERKRDRQRRTEERIHVHEEKERKAKEVQLFFTLEVQVRPPMLLEHRGQPSKWLQEAVRVEWPRRVCCVRRLGLYLNLGAT